MVDEILKRFQEKNCVNCKWTDKKAMKKVMPCCTAWPETIAKGGVPCNPKKEVV